jgi:hypothetical protein
MQTTPLGVARGCRDAVLYLNVVEPALLGQQAHDVREPLDGERCAMRTRPLHCLALPSSFVINGQNDIISVQGVVKIGKRDIGNGVLGKQLENLAELLVAERAIHLIQEDKPRSGEQNTGKRKTLLLVEGQHSVPIVLDIESLGTAQYRLEV